MKYFLSILLLFFVSQSVFSQIDSDNKSIAIPAIETDDPEDDPELIVEPVKVKAPKAEEKAPEVAKKPEKEFSMIEKDNRRNPAELFTDNLKRQLKFEEETEKRNNGSRVNQFLGEFKTTAKIVNIIYRDHQYPDGDMIRVFVNDDIVVPRVVLSSGNSGLMLPLEDGINKIEFQALNQGSSGPNTAEFKVLDESGKIIAMNQWNLATGVKAKIVVVREEGKTKRATEADIKKNEEKEE